MIHKKDEEVEKELKQAQKEFDELNESFKKRDNPFFMDKQSLLRLNERVKNKNKIQQLKLQIKQISDAQEQLYKVCMEEMVCPLCGGELIEENEMLKCMDCKKSFELQNKEENGTDTK